MTTTRGPYAKGVARKQEIIEVALELLAVGGLRQSTLDEIAKRVGITRPGLLHYFGSREALLTAVLEERDRRDIAHGIGVGVTGMGVTETMDEVLLHSLRSPGLARLFTIFAAEATDEDHPAHAFFRGRYQRIRTMIEEGIRAEQDGGVIDRGVDPGPAAQQILAVLDGLQLQWLLDPGLDPRTALRTSMIVLLPAPRT
ncbi:TetR/AcrR family transcriptional regulator [Winogradskya humida]|uniref:TetR family transcriptional regulator n=1 Tax=Winogradskya humida TaxID=113566 RepID=A0ABQ4A260_9ACTN|nr:TetR/AcrR family transcriptional regulator [Actinoplanes humidus]GIE24944.1 TetR family transcriptional regulator [Actinoplanes humidus]